MCCFYDQGTDHPSVTSFVGPSVNWSVGVIFENADIFMYHTFSISNTCFKNGKKQHFICDSAFITEVHQRSVHFINLHV